MWVQSDLPITLCPNMRIRYEDKPRSRGWGRIILAMIINQKCVEEKVEIDAYQDY
jgi:hypothetical protein